jgi:AcrR family transcriptional regulator
MRNGRRDRRVLRTRRLLQDALVALILEKGYEAVTVQDVLDRADVGRATFYAHFASREALLLSVFAEMREALRAEIIAMSPAKAERVGEGLGLVQPLFAHAAHHRDLYRALLRSRAGALLLRHLQSAIASPLQEHLEAACVERGLPGAGAIPPLVAGFVSGTLGVLVWWIEQDAPASPAAMDLLIERLFGPGVERVLTAGEG